MYRDIDGRLARWSRSDRRSPLVLCGARQVGKTYALRHLGETMYESCAYVNLLERQNQDLFDERFSAGEVLENISVRTGVDIVPGKTLVVIDEIQEAPHALTLMKAFKEQFPGQHIASAGSYLGIAYHAGHSFPVGKVDMVDMYPMTYAEFLRACGEERLADLLDDLDFERLGAFESLLQRYLRQYYYVGGMPGVVNAFLGGQAGEGNPDVKEDVAESRETAERRERSVDDYRAAREVQRGLLQSYDADFSKHPAAGVASERVRLAFDSIPTHLSRENHKFVFGHIAKGARSAQYDTAIQFIVDSGLATRVYRLGKLALPLRSYVDLSSFKLFMLDVGLLGAAMDVDIDELLLGDSGLTEYKGAMTEQYVCQQLVAAGCSPYYWSSRDSKAEIDFVLKHRGKVAPLEVKAEVNVHAKSLRSVCDRTGLHGYRASMRGYGEQDWMTNVPLWAVGGYFRREM
ncbi:ATP-binding protein [Bifidobacterium sp. ESL0763]|uniref:ATP-binding protein n=1 Tax=Bifidobacterium sp. ESL0763 TaxID=2983227 RepID=UPI0023FA1E22|nr:ATP-binding protein [Bifidobacterium sp. ESL0763]MDF7663368.1 ATP-binding protein [Bifidobacterium sp. ESL0763]